MEDFREARDVLVAVGAGIQVNGADDMVRWCSEMLANPDEARVRGNEAETKYSRMWEVPRKNAELLVQLLK